MTYIFILTHKFGIYVDYTDETPPRPFYVGKGTLHRCNDMRRRNDVHEGISTKYGIHREIIFETDDEQEAYAKEAEYVALFKTCMFDGWGANLDHGGLGGSRGIPKSPEHRRKIGDGNRGKKVSDEGRKHMSDGGKGKILTEEHKQKIREATKKALDKPEIRERQRAAAIHTNEIRWSKPMTDEQRKKCSEAVKKRNAKWKAEGRKPGQPSPSQSDDQLSVPVNSSPDASVATTSEVNT